MKLWTACRAALVLGLLTLLALLVGNASLQAINQAESGPEWTIVRYAFLALFVIHVFAVAGLWKVASDTRRAAAVATSLARRPDSVSG
jgi:succinate dehydrogenase hydrophobic anchor subunit